MRRDLDLIRLLLLEIEGEEPKPDLSAYDYSKQVYHLTLIVEAGLAEGHVVDDSMGNPAEVIVRRLTWKGHEFLDAARNDTIWNKAKGQFKEKAVSISFDMLKVVLIEYGKKQLGIS